MARALILHNPAARNAPEPLLLACISRELCTAGFSTEVAGSRSSGDLTALSRAAAGDGIERVVVCGGDGSVREAAQGLDGSPVALAIVPLGTVNILACEIGLPVGNAAACAALAARGRTRPIGLGAVDGTVFTFCASAGLDALAVAGVNLQEKRELGPWAYLHAAFMALLASGVPLLRVTLPDGEQIEAVHVFAARARRYGGARLFLSRGASVEADTLRLIAVTPPAARHLAAALPRVLSGGIEGSPGVVSRDVTGFTLESEGAMPIQADGDLAARTPAAFASKGRALELVFPV